MANLSNINGKFVVEQTTGYVGVGTTDPSYPIEVLNASAEIALNASGGSIYRVQSDSASNFIIRKEGVGDRLTINSDGISTFSNNVFIAGGNTNTGYDRYLKLYGNSDPATNVDRWAGLAVYNNGGNNVNELAFFTGSGDSSRTEKMRIAANGRVGIGTASPTNPLDVSNAASTSIVYQRTGVSAKKWGFHSDNDATYWQNITDGGLLFTLQNGGNVGIGITNPGSKLNVNGHDNGSAEFSVTLGSTTTAGGTANNASSTPVNKTLLTGYSIPYSGQTNSRLTTCGFLEFASTAGWTGSQRTWAITSGYDIGGQDSGAGGNKMAIVLGNAQNVSPQIGTNGTMGEAGDGDGANSLVACYWDNALNMRLADSSRLYTGNGGSAALPMITPGTDKNTGIWYPTSDTWAVSTAGEERMRITSGGKVIVGSNSSNALEVFSSGDTEIGFSYASHGNVYAKIIGDITQASPLGGEMAFQTATGGTLSERMRIDSSGYIKTPADKRISVGDWDNSGLTGGAAFGFSVQSTTPGLFLKETDQTSRKGFVAMSGGGMFIGGSVDFIAIDANNGNRAVTINSSLNVGIGTTAPTNGKLDVRGRLLVNGTGTNDGFGSEQTLTIKKVLGNNGVATKVAVVGHTHALQITAVVYQTGSSGCTATGISTKYYGFGTTGFNQVTSAGSGVITNISLAYLNTNPSGTNYVLTVTPTFTSGTPPTCYLTIRGQSDQYMVVYTT